MPVLTTISYDKTTVVYDSVTVPYDSGKTLVYTTTYPEGGVGQYANASRYDFASLGVDGCDQKGIVEYDSYITPDGVEYPLQAPDAHVLFSIEGEGMPSIEYVTQRGPYQHGDTLIDYFLRPRTIQMLIRHKGDSRRNYWNNRAKMLDAFRPNRLAVPGVKSIMPAPGVLRKHLANGLVRDLDVYIQSGPGFAPRQLGQWDEWAVQEVIRFTAFNPIYYSPIQESYYMENNDGLIFPVTWPITFNRFNNSVSIYYRGTWLEYPKIVLVGPMTNPRITLNTGTINEVHLQLNTIIPGRDVVTIDFSYSKKTILNQNNNNLLNYLSADSDIFGFVFPAAVLEIWPTEDYTSIIPISIEATGTGTNLPRFVGDTTIVSSATIYWNERFIGI